MWIAISAPRVAKATIPRRAAATRCPPRRDVARQLGAWGIGPADDVVVYDAAGGSNAAARLWWMLQSIGRAGVRAKTAGSRVRSRRGSRSSTRRTRVTAVEPVPARLGMADRADAEVVDARRASPAWRVLDVRSGERFRGETEPLDANHQPHPGANSRSPRTSARTVGPRRRSFAHATRGCSRRGAVDADVGAASPQSHPARSSSWASPARRSMSAAAAERAAAGDGPGIADRRSEYEDVVELQRRTNSGGDLRLRSVARDAFVSQRMRAGRG